MCINKKYELQFMEIPVGLIYNSFEEEVSELSFEEMFGEEIRRRRKKKRLSQEALAEKCDMSTRHLSDIENGKTNPKLDTVIRLCEACDIDTGELPELLKTIG